MSDTLFALNPAAGHAAELALKGVMDGADLPGRWRAPEEGGAQAGPGKGWLHEEAVKS